MEYYNLVFDPGSQQPVQWSHQDFEDCIFRKLDLSQAILAGSNFINCVFEYCSLIRADLQHTKLLDVHFRHCKLNQVDFGRCNSYGFHVDFQECHLDHSVFLNRILKKARFVECSMKETCFLTCDLTGVKFDQCNLELAKFGENNLTSADFSTSYNVRLNPDDNILKKARFSLHHLPGLLDKYNLVIIP